MRSGAHYCDVSFAAVLEEAQRLAPEARAAGITAILANGIHPSISNLMGVHVARQLDEVVQLQLGEASIYNFQTGGELTPRQWLEDPEESLAALQAYRGTITWMLGIEQQIATRPALAYRDGEWVEADPVTSGVDVPVGQGRTIPLCPYASTEPLFGSLPVDLALAPPVEMFFSPLPPQLYDVLWEQALRVRRGDADAEAVAAAFYDTVERDPQRWLTLPDGHTPAPPKIWARAVGRKEGRAARCTCWFTGPAWNVGGYLLTSVPLVATALQVLRGEITERGVMAAEAAIEPQPFFDQVAALLPERLPDGRLIGDSFEWMG